MNSVFRVETSAILNKVKITFVKKDAVKPLHNGHFGEMVVK